MKISALALLATVIVCGCDAREAPSFVDPVVFAGSTGDIAFRLELTDVRRLEAGEGVEAKASWTCDDPDATFRTVVYEDLDRDGQLSPGEWFQTIAEPGTAVVFARNSNYRSTTTIQLSRGTRAECSRVLEFATFDAQ